MHFDEIAAAAEAALADEAHELDLAPVNACLPLVGFAEGIFGPSLETYERPPTDADRFAAALVRSRAGTTRGSTRGAR